jgi:hypothetical protein
MKHRCCKRHDIKDRCNFYVFDSICVSCVYFFGFSFFALSDFRCIITTVNYLVGVSVNGIA